jgi:hypothetical protein
LGGHGEFSVRGFVGKALAARRFPICGCSDCTPIGIENECKGEKSVVTPFADAVDHHMFCEEMVEHLVGVFRKLLPIANAESSSALLTVSGDRRCPQVGDAHVNISRNQDPNPGQQ